MLPKVKNPSIYSTLSSCHYYSYHPLVTAMRVLSFPLIQSNNPMPQYILILHHHMFYCLSPHLSYNPTSCHFLPFSLINVSPIATSILTPTAPQSVCPFNLSFLIPPVLSFPRHLMSLPSLPRHLMSPPFLLRHLMSPPFMPPPPHVSSLHAPATSCFLPPCPRHFMSPPLMPPPCPNTAGSGRLSLRLSDCLFTCRCGMPSQAKGKHQRP